MRIWPLVLTGLAYAGLFGCSSNAPPRLATAPQDMLAQGAPEPPTTSRAAAVVAFASAQVGKSYCWGGSGPTCFDCSGLVKEAWASVGVRLPRTSGAMASELPEVPIDDLQLGDILWWPGHVGLYAGRGWLVDALDTPHGVVRRRVSQPARAFRPL
ncbi:MAG: C40 family peptidase [Polyangiaceae bacterium]